MLSLEKSQIFVKGLSLEFLEASDGFKKFSNNRKQEYARQYEALKERFLEELKGDEDLGEDSSGLTEEELDEMEQEAAFAATEGEDSSGLTEAENLMYLKGIAEAEADEESIVMEVFNCLNPMPRTTQKLSDAFDMDMNQTSTFNSNSIQGKSDSGKLFDISKRFNDIVEDFGGNDIIPDNTQNVFDYITNQTEESYTPTPYAKLTSEVINNTTPPDVPDDSKIIAKTPDLNISAEEKYDSNITVKVSDAKYNIEDKNFNKSWETPKEFTKAQEIEDVKSEVIDSLLGAMNTEDSLEEIKGEKEEITKLSVNTAVTYLKAHNIMEGDI